MKISIVILLIYAAVAAWVTPAYSQIPNYVILTENSEKWYDEVRYADVTMHVYPDGMEDQWTLLRHTIYNNGEVTLNTRRRLMKDEEGNVWGMGFVEAGAQPTTPTLLVQAPLYVGRTWTTVTYYTGYGTIERIFTCTAETTITVPYGTITCFLVEREAHEPDHSTRTGRVWYADGIGRVKGQDDWDVSDYELVSAIIFPEVAVEDHPGAYAYPFLTVMPNPFNPRTEIEFAIPRDQHVAIAIYDLLGQRVSILQSGNLVMGRHRVSWDGTNADGQAMPSGTYIVRLETESNVEARKVMLVR